MSGSHLFGFWRTLFLPPLVGYATTGLMVQTVQMYVFVQFLNKVGDLPVAPVETPGAFLGRGYGHCDRCRGPDSENCLEVPQLLFIEGRRHPCLYAEADPHGPVCSEYHRHSPVAEYGGRCPCSAGVQVITCRLWMRQSYSHSPAC